MSNLDMDLLRTFTAIVDAGGFTRAGERLLLSQSTVSLQMQRLERAVGTPLFQRQGRRMILSEHGQLLLGYARRILHINDEAVEVIHAEGVSGRIRFGASQDFTEHTLSPVLGRFARTHPNINLDVIVAPSKHLREAVGSGELDLALNLQPKGTRQKDRKAATVIAHEEQIWLAGADAPAELIEPIPLVVSDTPCGFRDSAINSLDAQGIGWRIAYSSPSLSGVLVAVKAGLGLTVRTPRSLSQGLVILDEGMPELPPLEVVLLRGNDRPSAAEDLLEQVITDSVLDDLPEGQLS